MKITFWKAKNEGRNLKSEKSQDYAQKPQRNCTFMNSNSGVDFEHGGPRATEGIFLDINRTKIFKLLLHTIHSNL